MPPGLQEGDGREVFCQGQVGRSTRTEYVNGLGVTTEESAEGDGV
jgi:hypothetical protein